MKSTRAIRIITSLSVGVVLISAFSWLGLGQVSGAIDRIDVFGSLKSRPDKPNRALNYLLVGADNKISTKGNFGLASGGDNNFSATGNTNIGSGGDHVETASVIHMNDTAAAAPAEVADFVKPLELHDNPATSTSVG